MPLEILQTILRTLDRLLIYFSFKPLGFARSRILPKGLPDIKDHEAPPLSAMRPLDELKQEVVTLFSAPCNIRRMKFMSSCLRREYLAKLQTSQACMLPSFCHALPTGQETGTFIAMDLGGSTFRVALVELSSRNNKDSGMRIKCMTTNKINEDIRRLQSTEFFDWMASKIQDTLRKVKDITFGKDETIPIGLAWSFPIEQTSHHSGKIQNVGKGFHFHEGRIGDDLATIIQDACLARGIKVRVDAVINDSSATLLSQAYAEPATTMAVILGTGTNGAVYLPVFSIGTDKFGVREPAWYARAEKVIVNTELSMFGKGILPETRWDESLNRDHQIPDFQPLEYMTTGRYLGEILRLIIIEAVDSCGFLGGVLPEVLEASYSLDTALLAAIEEDLSPAFVSSAERIQKDFGLESLPNKAEMAFLRSVVESISHRAAAYTATALHALWDVQNETETRPFSLSGVSKTSIACNGSVILRYPNFKSRCQNFIADLIEANASAKGSLMMEKVVLEETTEAAIFGAAVAVAIADGT